MAGNILFNKLPCIDPLGLRDEFLRAEPPLPIDWWGKANTFRNPLGPEPGRGWLLLRKEQVDELNTSPARFTLQFDSGDPEQESLKLKDIVFVRGTCLSPGWRGDKLAPYLVEVADVRILFRWVTIDKAYNLRDASNQYVESTMNGTAAWTWAGMIEDIWTRCVLDEDFPGLPFTPEGTPDGFAYWAMPAWDALNHALTRIGCAIKMELYKDRPADDGAEGQIAIVQLGVTATEEQAAAAVALQKHRIWDDYPVECEYAIKPTTVLVRFKKFPCPTGGTSPYYTLQRNDSDDSADRLASTEVILDDDLPAIYVGGALNNAAALGTRATERGTDYFRKLNTFNRREQQVYHGVRLEAFEELLGSQFAEVSIEDRGGGFRTTVAARPDRWLEDWKKKLDPCGEGAGNDAAVIRITSTTRAVSATGNTTNTSAVVTALANTALLGTGQSVSGTGIPAGATISSINSATQITLSAAATATNTGVTLRFGEFYPAVLQTYDDNTDSFIDGAIVYAIDINRVDGDACPFTDETRYLAVQVDVHGDGTPIYGADAADSLDPCGNDIANPSTITGYTTVFQVLTHPATGDTNCYEWHTPIDCASALVENVYGATVSFNANSGVNHRVELAGNPTLAVANFTDGDSFKIVLKQDATGSRTVTWFSGILWPGGSPPTLTTTAAKQDVFEFFRASSTEYHASIVGQNL